MPTHEGQLLAVFTHSRGTPPTSALRKTERIKSSRASGASLPTGDFITFLRRSPSSKLNPNNQNPKNIRETTVAPVVPVASPYHARVSAASHENFRGRLKSDVVVGLSEAPGLTPPGYPESSRFAASAKIEASPWLPPSRPPKSRSGTTRMASG